MLGEAGGGLGVWISCSVQTYAFAVVCYTVSVDALSGQILR
jgi:hypothetical protein